MTRQFRSTRVRRTVRSTAFSLLDQHFGTSESERYAQRLEILGRVLFGDLWEPDESKTTENRIEL